jgi:hypothetical protein
MGEALTSIGVGIWRGHMAMFITWALPLLRVTGNEVARPPLGQLKQSWLCG